MKIGYVVQRMAWYLNNAERHPQHIDGVTCRDALGNTLDTGVDWAVDDGFETVTQRLHTTNMVEMMMRNKDACELQL